MMISTSGHLISEGFAKRQAQRVVFARDLLDTLQRRELLAAEARVSSNTGLPCLPIAEGDTVAGVYRQRLDLASGRFAMIDDGLGFSLVPWTPSLERHLGHQVSMSVSKVLESKESVGVLGGRPQSEAGAVQRSISEVRVSRKCHVLEQNGGWAAMEDSPGARCLAR